MPGARSPSGFGVQGGDMATKAKASSAMTNAAIWAERYTRMKAGHATWRAARRERAEALARLVAEAPLEEVVKHVRPRTWIVTSLYLSGWSLQQICDVLGYRSQQSVNAVLQRPDAQQLIARIRQAQLDQVLQGKFGVQATAKAAAPEVMAHLSELAGARKDREGNRQGRARRDADAIRAGELVLTVSGDKVERHASLNVHLTLLEEMSEQELETFVDSGAWPARYQHVTGLLTGAPGQAPSSVPTSPPDAPLESPTKEPAWPPLQVGRSRR
jgi:lambda repressor-like predicted transcriptional regulator